MLNDDILVHFLLHSGLVNVLTHSINHINVYWNKERLGCVINECLCDHRLLGD